MYYSIVGQDADESLPLRKVHRPAHLERLQELDDQGRLLAAGPNPLADSAQQPEHGFSGSVVVAEFDSLEAAKQWASQDPYLLNGVYASVEVKPFIKVFPK